MITNDQIKAMLDNPSTDLADDLSVLRSAAKDDPRLCTTLLLSLYEKAGDDLAYDVLLRLVIKVGLMQLIIERCQESDEFAIRMGHVVLDGMEQLAAPPPVRRGRGRTVRSA